MIHAFVPYAPKDHAGNLGWAYRKALSIVPAGDWALFLDHDVTLLHRDWYRWLEQIISEQKEPCVLLAMANRTGNPDQRYPGAPEHHDIEKHRVFAEKVWKTHGTALIRVQTPFSGHAFLFPKEVGEQVGFIDGLGGVDTEFARGCFARNIPIYVMRGWYCYHFYRADGITVTNAFKAVQKG